MKLAERLIDLRKERKLSQLELAELMDISRQAVSRWEVGEATPSIENLLFLSRLYGVSLEYLISDGDEPEGELLPAAGHCAAAVEKRRGGKKSLGLALAAVCVFALGAVTALGLAGLGERGAGSVPGEVEARVYDDYVEMEPDGEIARLPGHGEIFITDASGKISSHVYSYSIVENDGGLIAGPVSNP